MKKQIFQLLSVLTLLISINGQVFSQDRITGELFSTRSEVIASEAMAATSHPLATQIALDILKKGGSAVDAAIAANAALGLMEPTGNGIGGDLFAIVWDAKSKRLYGLNASGRSPKSLSLKYFKENGYDKIPALGPLPVSVPGCVDGWFELHGRFGVLPMSEILLPTISYARNGFPVTELVAYYMEKNAPYLEKYPGFSDVFMAGGKTPGKGELFRNPYLANTLEKIGIHGRNIFYKGEIARTISAYMEENGGFLSYEDLEQHHSEWIDPISTNYRGVDVWELPPNGQGIAVLQILNILELYDIAAMGFGSAEYLHVLTEAKKLVYEDRAKYYADPLFASIPVNELISKSYAKERAALIDMDKASRSVEAGELKDGGTIYLSVADQDGNMVSLIQSNFRGMGSGMTPTGLGFVLQDRGELFSLEEGHANVYEAGKRPFHTIIPGFITKDGQPWISFGLMGGAMQPQGHVQVVVNLIDFSMNLQEAGDAPRINHSGSSQPTGSIMEGGGVLQVESGIAYSTIRDLMQRGHKIAYALGPFGGYQAIKKENGVYFGASESRKDGQASGF